MSETASIVVTDRDRALLVELYESRAMTLQQAAALHFDCHAAYAKKRVAKLKQAGLLRERPRRRSEPSVLHLTRDGWHLLRRDGSLECYPTLSDSAFRKRSRVSDLTLRHELGVIAIKAAFVRALDVSDRFTLSSFCTWPQMLEFSANLRLPGLYSPHEVSVKPDGRIRVRERVQDTQYEMTFYLEVDRSTESQDALMQKAVAYLEHYRSGGFALAEGGTREQFRQYPFRLLIMCASAERQHNLLGRLLHGDPPILTHAWITTCSEACRDPLGPIWLRPVDLRNVRPEMNQPLNQSKTSLFDAA